MTIKKLEANSFWNFLYAPDCKFVREKYLLEDAIRGGNFICLGMLPDGVYVLKQVCSNP